MNVFKAIWRRLRRGSGIKQEIDEELRFHIEQRTAENIAAGMSPEDAAREARKRFGNIQSVREECRDVTKANLGETVVRDLRFALRQIRRNPAFAAMVIMTIALCIGANLAIFAVVDAILLRALPFPESNRLVVLYNSYPKANIPRVGASLTSYYERRGQIKAFSSMAAISQTTGVVGDTGLTSRENIGRVTPEFFDTLGITPFMGRAFKEEEMTYNTDHEIVLSYECWQSQFNSNPDVLGKPVRIDGIWRAVVGVLPPHFRFLSFQASYYEPLSSDVGEHDLSARHSSTDKIEIARLAPGYSVAQAQSQVDAHDNAHAAEFPEATVVAESGFHSVVAPLRADHVASVRPMLVLLQAAVVFLLLIGGVNLVNLLLVRASGRARELGIRQSLGATRRNIVIQVMAETLVLAICGGVLGLGVGAVGIQLLGVLGVNQLPLGANIEFNGREAAVALLTAIAVGIAISIPAAWFNLRGDPVNAIRGGSRTDTVSLAAQRLRHGFIVTQIALAFVLLVGASLLEVSLKRAMAVSPGFQVDHVLTGQFNLPWNGYHEITSFYKFFDRLYPELKRLPGVAAVGVSSGVPLTGEDQTDALTVPGYVPPPGTSVLVHDDFSVAGDYFTAMGIPLREGRYLNNEDGHAEERHCVVDEDFARHYWPNGNALGKQIYQGTKPDYKIPPFIVVGVVGPVKQISLTESRSKGAIYMPYSYAFSRDYYLVVRTSVQPEAMANALRSTVRQIDPELPLNDIRSMDMRVSDSLVTRRSPALLTGVFAAVALLLAAVGTYGVLSYAVSQRRREIGVRMALGALPAQIRRQFLSLGMRLLTAGAICGVIGAWMAGRAMQSILFNVPPLQATTLAIAAVVMTTVSLLACWLPAQRASAVDPMEALRCE